MATFLIDTLILRVFPDCVFFRKNLSVSLVMNMFFQISLLFWFFVFLKIFFFVLLLCWGRVYATPLLLTVYRSFSCWRGPRYVWWLQICCYAVIAIVKEPASYCCMIYSVENLAFFLLFCFYYVDLDSFALIITILRIYMIFCVGLIVVLPLKIAFDFYGAFL